MNTFLVTPRTKMEHLEDTTRWLQEPSGAAKVDIKVAFWSVLIAVLIRKHPMGIYKVPSHAPSRLDKVGPGMVGVQDKSSRRLPSLQFRV